MFVANQEDFQEKYKDEKEEMPFSKPNPMVWIVETTLFVDLSHAENCTTRRSHTGCAIFVNSSLMLWYIKR